MMGTDLLSLEYSLQAASDSDKQAKACTPTDLRIMDRSQFVICLAGHIDHGKSALVQALTGGKVDRLPEEKRRGITIDLGFAHFDAGGRRFALIDVPGHEKFIHTMVAGVSGVDAALLVVAAD